MSALCCEDPCHPCPRPPVLPRGPPLYIQAALRDLMAVAVNTNRNNNLRPDTFTPFLISLAALHQERLAAARPYPPCVCAVRG